MKKLALALLLALSIPALAQKNELVFSPGAVYYQGHTSNHPKTNYIGDLEGGSWRLAATYLRNIKWLQLGAGIEYGKLGYNEKESKWMPPNPDLSPAIKIDRETVADLFVSVALQANFRYPVRKVTLYAGVAGGYFASTARHSTNYGGYPGYDAEYPLDGPMLGAQAGAAYNILPRVSLSANVNFRSVDMNQFPRVRLLGPSYNSVTFYDRLTYYTFAIGAHYRF